MPYIDHYSKLAAINGDYACKKLTKTHCVNQMMAQMWPCNFVLKILVADSASSASTDIRGMVSR